MPALLVVDDESSILLAFRRAYRNQNMEVLTAETAGAGLAIARERRPDVGLLDIPVPGMFGWGSPPGIARNRRSQPGHLHHGKKHDRHGHRGDEVGSV